MGSLQKWRKVSKEIKIAGTFLLLALMLRWGWVQGIGMGGGQSITSPGMSYRAHAQSWNGATFWGADRHYSKLWLIDPLGRESWSVELEGVALDWRQDGAVTWAPDSSVAIYRAENSDGTIIEVRSPSLPSVKSVDEAALELLDDTRETAPLAPPSHRDALGGGADGDRQPNAGDAQSTGPGQ